MESAIPEHLRTLRRCPSAMPDEHEPPFPAWTARFSPLTGRIVMAYCLWHEIVVVPAESQYFEYVNSHPDNGLLRQDSGGSL